ncbi:MAG: hypothetical protein ACAI35_04405 [Candidatus Methylacidiphilales bacterium]|nr:hypothetical protein [Candidatus Methylacidiphilales bacterium]
MHRPASEAERARVRYDFLTQLRLARELYEYKTAGYRSNLWRGLTNRWNNALKYARSL